uniref:Ig-like domain-containing protein n=1 Tax=Oryzias latipes TaxID=8090 RepID=A0A3B3HZJ8_ORYLA
MLYYVTTGIALQPPCLFVIQPGGEVIAAEGDSLTLNCTFETTFTPHLFWYRREKNGNINYILRRHSYGKDDNAPEFQKDRFDAELKDKSVPLKIQKLHVSDSAVYYSCWTLRMRG